MATIFPDCPKCKKGILVPISAGYNGFVWVCINPKCEYKVS